MIKFTQQVNKRTETYQKAINSLTFLRNNNF